MDKDIEKRIQERYRQCDSKHFDKFIMQNPDIRRELENILASIPWFKTIRNIYVAWNHDVHDVVKCKYCGKPLNIDKAIYGRHLYCSKRCADLDPDKIELQKRTCLKKYGASSPLLNEECRRKRIATCRSRFGNDTFAGSDEYKRRVPTPFLFEKTHEKARQTKIRKYGDDYGMVLFEKRRDSMVETNMRRYGVPFVLMNKDKRLQASDTMEKRHGSSLYWRKMGENANLRNGFKRIEDWKEYVIPLFKEEEYEGHEKEYSWKCSRCGNEFKQRIYVTGLGDDRLVPRCEKCFPNSASSIGEKEVLDFIKSIYDGRIMTKAQTVLKNRKELDIYMPGKNVAVEFDGMLWHSEQYGKDQSYHLSKTNECNSMGIHLVHIFEDEWINKKEIVKDRLMSILGISSRRIFARKCKMMEISSKESNEFLERNHLQGGDNSSIRYGLFHEDELVSVMTFGRPRFNRNYDWELIRYASKLGVRVIGGASKLLNAFISIHKGSIISYADRRYSNGNLYENLGFKLIGVSKPNYWYFKKNIRFNRYRCQKHKLPKLLGDGFDPVLSEQENMLKNGYKMIYDCGNLIFELK